jgi:type IV pilus assembly protein PilB
MGIEPFLVATALSGVLSQRLARRLCLECREPIDVPRAAVADLLRLHGDEAVTETVRIQRGKGCGRCHGSGYRGRFALAEMMTSTDAIDRLIISRASANEIRAQAIEEGMRTIAQEGVASVLDGRTSLEELGRIVR